MAKANLSASQYQDADKAHTNSGCYVSVTGTLHPGRQPRELLSISNFTLLAPPPAIENKLG
jgi:hypothetical protein